MNSVSQHVCMCALRCCSCVFIHILGEIIISWIIFGRNFNQFFFYFAFTTTIWNVHIQIEAGRPPKLKQWHSMALHGIAWQTKPNRMNYKSTRQLWFSCFVVAKMNDLFQFDMKVKLKIIINVEFCFFSYINMNKDVKEHCECIVQLPCPTRIIGCNFYVVTHKHKHKHKNS